jgi:hypothetical protein
MNTQVRITDNSLGQYDFIFGRDYLAKGGIDLLFSNRTIQWDGMHTAMKEEVLLRSTASDQVEDETNTVDERASPQHVKLQAEQIAKELLREDLHAQEILNSRYEEQDLDSLIRNQKHLTRQEQQKLAVLLHKYADQFNGMLGTWPNVKISLELLPGAEPYHCGKPIRIPRIHLQILEKEIARLIEIGVIEQVYEGNAGPWCSPTFIIPKKDGRVRVITDFRELNKRIRRKPWPMPHILDMLEDIGGFEFVTAIDLSMGFYHFELDDLASEMTTFILPSGLYKYRRLPMGLSVSPDIFQGHMQRLFADMDNAKIYIDDLLIYTKGSFDGHLQAIDEALRRLQSKNMAVNAEKTFWAVKEVDYLGFRLTQQGVMPQPKKVAAIQGMRAPRNKKQMRSFIGLVNFYRYMWRQRSHLLAPLAELAGKKAKFEWTTKHQEAFDAIKAAVSKDVLLSFPDYSLPFELYTDASDQQMGAVLMQGTKTLAFWSRKLKPEQKNYSVGEKEMLSVVEALKEFRTMVLGYPIHIYTDHKNWTHDKVYRNARVLRW